MELKNVMTVLDKKTGELRSYDTRTGEVISTDGVLVHKERFAYSLELCDAICGLVREGTTVTKIAEMPGMPNLHLIYAWMRYHPDFRKAIELARQDRAEHHMDKAADVLEGTEQNMKSLGRDELNARKFVFDSHLKMAEKNNPEKLMEKKNIGAPLQIIINTGIIRDEDGVKTIEAHGQRVDLDGGQRIEVGEQGDF